MKSGEALALFVVCCFVLELLLVPHLLFCSGSHSASLLAASAFLVGLSRFSECVAFVFWFCIARCSCCADLKLDSAMIDIEVKSSTVYKLIGFFKFGIA